MLNRLSRSLSFRLLLIGLISGHLSLHVSYVRDDIGVPPRIDRAVAITEKVPVDIRILGPDIDWASDPAFPELEQLDFASSPRFSDDPGAWADELQGIDFADLDNHDFLRMRQGGYEIVVSTPRISDVSDGPALVPLILGLGLSFLVLAYAAVTWLFRPIRTIREGAEHIGRGNFDFRISKVRRDQLGDLATDINRMAGDVESLLDAKRALLLGISHELRTPLSRMRLTLESRTVVIVSDLVNELLDDFFSREADRIRVELPDEPVTVSVDEARITLLLKNLISNALRYSKPEDGLIELTISTADHELAMTVTDHGSGLSEDQAEHIGEPFYRSDASRARESGGTGLGLYLAALVAKAHGGSLKLLDTDSQGASFEVRIPLIDR
jgi:signal transduction histidine kinase